MKDIEVEVIFYGKVQRVGLRANIQNRAEELGVRGVARNLEDGCVEVIAQGERVVLEKFVEKIKKGTPFSKIEEVEITWYDFVQDSMTEFSIE
jgi:acylphosphatase